MDWSASGRRGAVADDARAREVGLRHSSCEAGEQRGAIRCGASGAKQALERVRQVAKERKKERFTALFHHISIGLLDEAFFELKKDAAPGVDDLTWQDYEGNLENLHERVQRGAYRALPSRRTYIPKPDGRQRTITSNCTSVQSAFGF